MVKADFTRDYYGDLNLSPNADVQEIKKQFKKLALTYHPDRNPGRETQVTAQFQLIQSAHEVLTDTQERAKYDANRRTAAYRPSYTGPTSSGVRGNPWQNAGSQFPPPPKPSGTRRAAPPPSEGAKRYQQFNNAAPKASQYSAQEGAEARRSTYAAWEHMRPDHTRKPAPTRATPSRKPPPPPRQTPNAGHTPGVSPQRKGFMPNTPGGDEPAAPRGAYFTTQRAAPEPPPVPPRNPSPINPSASTTNAGADPLNQFRDQRPQFEPRTSTPYATHGGEKFNLHESANIGRSKSTRESATTKDVPRTGSDPNLGSPLRTRSTTERTSARTRKPTPASVHIESEDSGSDDLLFTSGSFGKPRRNKPPVNRATPLSQTEPNAAQGSVNPHLPPRMDSAQQNGQSDEAKIFTFNVNNETFQRTQPPSNGFASSKPEDITTTFTQESWGKDKFDGVFEAGYFNPVKKPPTTPTRGRARNGSRSRSPNKARPISIPPLEPQVATDAAEDMMESPGGTKFQKNAWQGVFKPATFAPTFIPPKIPPPSSARPVNKKTRTTSARPTMGTAAVVNDGEMSDHKPLFDGKSTAPSAFRHPPSPDAMDVDTPPVKSAHTVPKFVPGTANGNTADITTNGAQLNGNVQPAQRPKRPATHSQSPVEAESLRVNLQDLKVKDINELITDLNLPAPPPAPDAPPPPTMTESISKPAQDKYMKQFEVYMRDWDLFNTKMIIHFFARKNQAWNSTGWEDDSKIENYREALRVDAVVDKHWHNARELHEKVMKDYVVIRERMKMRAEFEGIR